MEIKIGKYTLCSDQWYMWIEGTDYYLAVYKHSDGEEVTRIVEFTQEEK